MTNSTNQTTRSNNNMLIRMLPYLIVFTFLMTCFYYCNLVQLPNVQENQVIQKEYESLNQYRQHLNDIQTLLIKILRMPTEYTRDLILKEVEKSLKEWNDYNATLLIQAIKKFVSDMASLNLETEKSISQITIEHNKKTETLKIINTFNEEIDQDIHKVKSIVSEVSQKILVLNDNYFRDIEKSIISAFSNLQTQNQTFSKKLEKDFTQFFILLKANNDTIQEIFNCRTYIQSLKDLIISAYYTNIPSNIQNIQKDIDALCNIIQIVLNQFENQEQLRIVRGQLKICQNLISQLINRKITLIQSGHSVQTESDAEILKLKNEVFSKIEMMTHQLKQYKYDVAQKKINDLSIKLSQLINSFETTEGYAYLNDIRSILNKLHSLYYIRNLIYELQLRINNVLTPLNHNAQSATQKEIRPIYEKLNTSILNSDSLKRIFSESNFFSLMNEISGINKKIVELSNMKNELENIQIKLAFELKNKEHIVTNTFINSNQSLIDIIQSIQTIEKNINECQSKIKQQRIEKYNNFANQMMILTSIFSFLLVCSLLLRYKLEKKALVKAARKDHSAARLKASINRKLIFSAIFLLILSLSFNALLTLGSLEKLYVESTVSQFQIIGTDLQRNIDRSLRYGKRIDKFVRMNKMLSDTKYSLTTKYLKDEALVQWKDIDLNVSIALPGWNVIYSTNNKLIGKSIPKRAQIDYTDLIKKHESKNLSDWTEYKDRYYVTLPVKGGESKDWEGTVVIDFNDTQIRSFLKQIFMNNMKMIGAILLIGSFFLVISLTYIVHRSKNVLPKILISIVMVLIIGISQAVFSIINSSEFKKFYLQINIQKAEILTSMLKEDVDYLLGKGVKIHKLVKMENMLKEVIDVSPELKDISIYDSNNEILHLANKNQAFDFVRSKQELQTIDFTHTEIDPEFQLKKNLIETDNESSKSILKGTIITNISKNTLFKKISEIRLDSVTVFIISFLFMVELLIMIFRIIRSSSQTAEDKTSKIEFSDIRPVAFIFFFSFDLCISFLPLYMEQLYTPMFGLSKDLVLSLPISGEMFFAGITAIIAGWLLDRINWHLPFLYGLIICGIGSFYSWLSPDAYHLLFSRCLTGIGYGLSFMAAQGFVVSYTDNKTKTQGLTQLFAGLMAGSICGGAAGAMVADRIGYGPIFFISGILLIVTVLYTFYFMRAGFQKKAVEKKSVEESVEKDRKGLSLIFKFILNRNILSLLILGILPTAFSIVGFINFFYPVYLNRLGETQSNIGRIYMIYGLCLIYIAPYLSKFVDRSDNKKLFIVITGLIGGLAFTSFYFTGGFWATVITVLLLGISSSFDASRTYALNLKITKTLGEGIAMGIFNLAEKIGQVVGPLIFGLFFITTSLNNTMAAFGLVYIIITIFFMLTAQSDKKIKMQNR